MLLDTSGLLSLVDRTEPHHAEARRLYASARRFTHGYVYAELIALATARKVPRRDALDLVTDLAASPDVETVWIDAAPHEEAMDLLRRRLDKTYSLCDAVSFVLMRRRGEREALTTDRHFEQEGFIKLLG